MGDIIQWILLALAVMFGGGFLFEKSRANRAVKKAAEQTKRADRAERQVHLEQEASKIKNELAQKSKASQQEKDAAVQAVDAVDKEVELSDEIKKLAADQSARAHARADRMRDDQAD